MTAVRAGQMMDADKTWNVDPQAAAGSERLRSPSDFEPSQRPILSVHIGPPHFSRAD